MGDTILTAVTRNLRLPGGFHARDYACTRYFFVIKAERISEPGVSKVRQKSVEITSFLPSPSPDLEISNPIRYPGTYLCSAKNRKVSYTPPSIPRTLSDGSNGFDVR